MVYRDYICDDCGFSSEEKSGVYLCPKCGNKMRIAKQQGAYGGGDNTVGHAKLVVLFIIAIFGYGFCLCIDWVLGLIGIVIVTIILIVLWKSFNASFRDKAIPVDSAESQIQTQTAVPKENKDVANYCINCGTQLRRDAKFCPNCGTKIQ